MADCIRGFNVMCIHCGEGGDNVRIILSDVTQFSCTTCNGDFDSDEVEKAILNWRLVLDWIATCPERNDE